MRVLYGLDASQFGFLGFGLGPSLNATEEFHQCPAFGCVKDRHHTRNTAEDDRKNFGQTFLASCCDRNPNRPSIGGVGDASDIPIAFEPIDQAGDGRSRDHGFLSKISGGTALGAGFFQQNKQAKPAMTHPVPSENPLLDAVEKIASVENMKISVNQFRFEIGMTRRHRNQPIERRDILERQRLRDRFLHFIKVANYQPPNESEVGLLVKRRLSLFYVGFGSSGCK